MIIALAAGGVTSYLLTAFARGDVALSISLTVVISLLSVVTIPLIFVFDYAQIMDGAAGEISVAETAIGVFLIASLPALIGMAIRRWAEGFGKRIRPTARRISDLFFLLILWPPPSTRSTRTP